MTDHKKDTTNRIIINLAIAVIIVSVAFLFIQCLFSGDVHFIINSSKAEWITIPHRVEALRRPVNPYDAIFRKTFIIEERYGGNIHLNIKALHSFRLFINDLPVDLDRLEAGNWKRLTRVNITNFIRGRANTIRVEVKHRMGQPLLFLYLEGSKDPVKTDTSWTVQMGNSPVLNAVLADDTIPYKVGTSVLSPYEYLLNKISTLAGMFVLMGLLFMLYRFIEPAGFVNNLPKLTLLGVLLMMSLIFCFKSLRFHPFVGFDAASHAKYIGYIISNKKLPVATDGYSMFHPPLFYIVSALLGSSLAYIQHDIFQRIIIKFIPFACGLGNVLVTYLIGKKIFRDRPKHIFFITLFAGIMPMNIYLSAYIGNEPMHAFLVTCSILFTINILTDAAAKYTQVTCLGVFMGLALITKITAITIIPVIFIFVLLKMAVIDRAGMNECVKKISLLFFIIFAISGWYYARNLIMFGKPVMINWHLPTDMWWQDPGFHTLKYYFSFGEVLQHPLYSGFRSFWDSIYSTFWGDGYAGGVALINYKGVMFWNYEYMSIVYLLAIPATAIFIIGLFRMIKSVFNNSAGKRFRLISAYLVSCLFAVWFFVLYSTLKVPVYGQAKAFYGLSVMAPISVVFSLGFVSVDNFLLRLPSTLKMPSRFIFFGWLGTLVFAIFHSYLF